MYDSPVRYGLVTKAFHWAMALLFLGQMMKLGDRIAEGEHWVGQTIVPWHGSVGALLLGLVALRVVWSLAQASRRPRHTGVHGRLVKAGHLALYFCMVYMPVSGAMMVLGKGYPFKSFGVTLVPGSGEKTQWMLSAAQFHSTVAWFFLILIIGHIAMAVVHRNSSHGMVGSTTNNNAEGDKS